jgi:transposase
MAPIKLKPHELEKIKGLLKIEEPRVIRRANILNCLHLGYGSSEVAAILNVDRKTVYNIGSAYIESGFECALYDDERSGRPIDIDDRERSRIIAMVCSNPPEGTYRWTLDLIVDEAVRRELIDAPISRETIRIILQEHKLKPWQEKMWCIAEMTEEYINRMEDVLDVYERAHDPRRPVICLDEKPVPLISNVVDPLPPRGPGETMLKDYEYERGGSANVFFAIEPKAGIFISKVTETRCGLEFSIFMSEIAYRYKDADKIVLVMDNLSTHTASILKEHMGDELGTKLWERFEVHYTPKHASWLNQAEIAIGIYSRQALGDGRVGNLENLKELTNAWNERINAKGQTINWRFTKQKARKSLSYTVH